MSCAGYEFRDRENPFEKKGIKSISVPMFVNKTNLKSVSNSYSKEVISMLENFRGLKVYSGHSDQTDAVLIGVVSTPNGYDPIQNEEIGFLDSEELKRLEVNERSAFTLQTIKSMTVDVRVVILKRPKKEEIDFLMNYFDFNKAMFPQSVFYRNFRITNNLFVDNSFGNTEASQVRGVRNKGIEIFTVNSQARNLSNRLRDMIINAL